VAIENDEIFTLNMKFNEFIRIEEKENLLWFIAIYE
jgi:hypothetical protein